MKFFLVIFILTLSYCTNYSSSKTRIVAPILIAAAKNNSDYAVRMRVTNQEPLFAGYKLYIGNTESEARNPSDLAAGLNCENAITIIPNQPVEFVFDIKTTTSSAGLNSGSICTFRTNSATSGKFIVARSLLVSIVPSNQTRNRVNPSLPSNTLILP